MITDLAYLGLIAGLVLSCLGTLTGIWGGRQDLVAWTRVSQRATVATAGLIALATLSLWWALSQDRFELLYVWNQSERALPLFYKLAALWSGQEGSLLFWAFILAIYAVAVNVRLPQVLAPLLPWVNVVLCLNLAFFLLLVTVPANPFVRLPLLPPDGAGLNPLLQNYWMVIHPVMLYLGYIGLTVPFALAVAALAQRQMNIVWLRQLRRWTLIAWLCLSVGILMGSQWAYMELGWGGYWAWDPVENASLLPWLTATGFLHSLIVQEQRGTMKLWNLILIAATYFLVLLGTFTTRSDIVASVHSFAKSAIGLYFVGLLLAVLLGFLVLLWLRRDMLGEQVASAAWFSRESAFLANNWLFAGITFATLWGTYFPVFSEVLTGDSIAVAAPYFEKVNGPLFLILLLLMGIGPMLNWRVTERAVLQAKLVWPGSLALVGALVWSFFWPFTPFAIAGFGVCVLVFTSLVQEFVHGIRARQHIQTEPLHVSLQQLCRRQGRRYGGYLVHLGIVCMGVAIIGNEFYQEVRHITLAQDESYVLGPYRITYQGMEVMDQANLTQYRALLTVQQDTRSTSTVLVPRRNVYFKAPDAPTSEVGLHTTWREDLYVVLNGWTEGAATATFSFYLNPLMVWLWVGGIILVLGTLIALWPHPATSRSHRTTTG